MVKGRSGPRSRVLPPADDAPWRLPHLFARLSSAAWVARAFTAAQIGWDRTGDRPRREWSSVNFQLGNFLAKVRVPSCGVTAGRSETTLQRRQIGSLEVTVVGIGCDNFGGRMGEARTREVVNAALDSGVNFFDTADVYPVVPPGLSTQERRANGPGAQRPPRRGCDCH